jgi:hypothetical protein
MKHPTNEAATAFYQESGIGEVTSKGPDVARPSGVPGLSPVGTSTGWEIVIGTVVGLSDAAAALISIPRFGLAARIARTVVPLAAKDIGSQAVVAFEDGDSEKPIILGVMLAPDKPAGKVTVEADGDKFMVIAEREIELRCGAASITLTRAGKVLIKGEYVLTRSKGLNRIKGAAVSIN